VRILFRGFGAVDEEDDCLPATVQAAALAKKKSTASTETSPSEAWRFERIFCWY
jgi:hypothetical protein